jgi:hypothetical protein
MRIAKLPLGLLILGLSSCRRASVVEHASPSSVPSSTAAPAAFVAPEPPAASAVPLAQPAVPNCAPQIAQDFLVEAHLRAKNLSSARAQLEWWALLQRSIRYRTEQYGYYKDFGLRSWNPRSLQSQMRVTKFMGLPVVLHERVIPALHCVELALQRECSEQPYRPRTLAGVRQTNTYFGGDVTNHVYGIALDIDPSVNPCCNCIEPWRSNPRCRGSKTDFERMAMPRCWITTFERYGFYWLGHDELKDTMHFEFLGDPSKISSSAL